MTDKATSTSAPETPTNTISKEKVSKAKVMTPVVKKPLKKKSTVTPEKTTEPLERSGMPSTMRAVGTKSRMLMTTLAADPHDLGQWMTLTLEEFGIYHPQRIWNDDVAQMGEHMKEYLRRNPEEAVTLAKALGKNMTLEGDTLRCRAYANALTIFVYADKVHSSDAESSSD